MFFQGDVNNDTPFVHRDGDFFGVAKEYEDSVPISAPKVDGVNAPIVEASAGDMDETVAAQGEESADVRK